MSPAKTPPASAIARSLAAIRRWLRHTWLARLPLVSNLFTSRSTYPDAPKKRKPRVLECERLEPRALPNDPLGLAQTAFLGGVVAEMAARLPTPSQVLMHGWGVTEPAPAPGAEASPLPIANRRFLQEEEADQFFLDLSAQPARQPDQEESVPKTPEPESEPAPPHPDLQAAFVSAVASSPLVERGVLDSVAAALADPIPDETPEEEGKGGSSGGFSDLPEPANTMSGDSGASAVGSAPEISTASPSGSPSDVKSGLSPEDLLGLGVYPSFIATSPFVDASPANGANPGNQAKPKLPLPAPVFSESYGDVPLAFEVNAGQTADDVQYLSRGAGYVLFLTSDEIVLALDRVQAVERVVPSPEGGARQGQSANPEIVVKDELVRDVVRVGFVGAREGVELVGVQELAGRSNYFRDGSDPVLLTDLAQYGQVIARDVWQGVDVLYQGNEGRLRYDLIVRPDADLSKIALSYSGVESVTVDDQGRLLLQTAGGTLVQETPLLYQDRGNGKESVRGRYEMHADGTVGFRVEDYDRSAALVIDPTLTFSSYAGGTDDDAAYAVTTDYQGHVVVVGSTASVDFPPSGGTLTGTRDVFVSKYTPFGDELLYTSYLGGAETGAESASAVTTDAGGYVYVTGVTSAANFPLKNATDSSLDGDEDAFLFVLSPAGDALVFSTYLGGTGDDRGNAIALDDAGRVYVAGYAEDNLPTTGGGALSYAGSGDAFLSVYDLSLSSPLIFSSYYGGSDYDEAFGLALDRNGKIYLAGETASDDLSLVGAAYDDELDGARDGFVARGELAGLTDATYVGGSDDDGLRAVTVDQANGVVVAGYTQSSDYPDDNGYDTSLSGTQDAVVTRFNEAMSGPVWSTYLGGTGDEEARGVALDGADNVYAVGVTTSTSGFPLQAANQGSHGGGTNDAFVTRIESGGASLGWSSYLGGSGEDEANGLSVDLDGNLVVVGVTDSSNFPTASPLQGSLAGCLDAFVARYDYLKSPRLTSISSDCGVSNTDFITTDQTLTLGGTAPAGSTVTIYRADLGGAVGQTTADGSGNWTFDYTGTTLEDGIYAFTFTATVSGHTGVESSPYLVTVDRTDPAVSLVVAPTTYDLTPEVRVVFTDRAGVAATATVTLDVDLNNDGDFLDSGEAAYTTGTMTTGLALFDIAPALALGTYAVRARVTDQAGNEKASAVRTVVVQTSGSSWTTTDVSAQVDPLLGDGLLQRGNYVLFHDLDWDKSPGADVGLNPALVYSSERVDARPILQGSIQTDNGVALPSTITFTLTWNGGSPQTPQVYSTSGLTPGELLTFAQQVSTAVTTTGRYTYTLDVSMDYGSPITRSISGAVFVVAEDASPLGAGWTLAGVDRLVSISASGSYPAGMLRIYGSGGHSFYADNGSGYDSPVGDPGTLTLASGTYTYETPDGRTWEFDSAGYQRRALSTDGLAVVTYSYDGSNRPANVETPDGALTTLSYDITSGLLTTIATGSRTVTATMTGTDLTQIQNPDGGLHSITYDGSHKLTREELGNLRTTFAYAGGILTSYTPGDGGAAAVNSAVRFGLAGLAAVVRPNVVDAVNRTTRYLLDPSGRATQQIAADGGVTSWTRDGNGRVTGVDDPVGRHTTLVLDSAGYVTQETLPDGSSRAYVYNATYHTLAQYTDEGGNLWTFTYDGAGNRLTEKDPLGSVTSMTYNTSSGLLETVEDALNRVTTYLHDSSRRLETRVNALGGLATWAYDANGNLASFRDEADRPTSYTFDSMGRMTYANGPAAGPEQALAYNEAGLVVGVTDALGRGTSFVYDRRGLQTRVVEAVGNRAQRSGLSSFDAAGQLIGSRSPNGLWTRPTYDAAGRTLRVTDPARNTSGVSRDLAGQVVSQRGPTGVTAGGTYTPRGLPSTSTDGLGNTATMLYDSAGKLSETVNPLGVRTTFAYDARKRLIATTEAAGTGDARTTSTVYDAVGNVYRRYDALGRLTEYEYDGLNRLVKVTEAKGVAGVERSMTFAYDAVGNQTGSTDWRGFRSESVYDGKNRRTVLREAVNASDPSEQRTTTWTYDAQGNVTAVDRQLGQRTELVYDALNRLVKETLNSLGSWWEQAVSTFRLDADGNTYGTTDPNGVGWGQALDLLGSPTVSKSPLGFITRLFNDATGAVRAFVDELGNRSEAANDRAGRLTQVKDAAGGLSSVVYDAAGNVKAQVDPLGNRTSFSYDVFNRRVAVEDALHNVSSTVYDKVDNVTVRVDALIRRTSFTYDALNRNTQVEDALHNLTTSVYDAGSNLTVRVDALNRRTSFTYDALNRNTQVEDALHNLSTTVYDVLDRAVVRIDALGRRTTSTYDSLNRLTSVQNAEGGTRTTVYDLSDRVLAQVDELGRRTSYVYDKDGRQVAVEDALGRRTTSVLDAAGNVRVQIDALGRRTTFTYDALNRRETTRDALNGLSTVVYDAASNVLAQVDALGRRTSFIYDALNRRVAVKDALNGLASTVYDEVGNVAATVDPNGNRTSFTYDALNRRTYVENALHQVSETDYDAVGNVVLQIDALSRPTSYAYDALNRRTHVEDALGNISETKYDAVGNVDVQIDALGYRTSFTYDNLNRRTRVEDALHNVTSTAYDAVGNVTGVTDARLNATAFSYDALNRQTGVTNPDSTTRYSDYDEVGNVKAVQDENGHRTSFVYDALNRRTEVEDALHNRTTTVYDAVGNATVVVNALNYRTTTAYDALNRPTEVEDALNGVATVVYDAVGNRLAQVDPLGRRTSFTYDELNRVTEVEDALEGVAETLYDDVGNVEATVDQLGRRTSFTYDDLNRRTEVIDALEGIATTVYDEVGNVVASIDPNGNATSFTYDALRRRTVVEDALHHLTTTAYDAVGNAVEVTNARGYTTTLQYDSRNRRIGSVDALSYTTSTTYDGVGNVTGVKDARGYWTYSAYDDVNRLKETTHASGYRTTYLYDAVGNRTVTIDQEGYRTTASYDALNRPTEVKDAGGGIATTIYDAVGNKVGAIDPVGNGTSYAYDDLNRLEAVLDAETGLTLYGYDAVGNRVSVTDPVGNTTSFVYDDLNRVIEEVDPLGASATMAYDAGGRLTSRTDRLGRRRDFGYDEANRNTSEVWVGGDTPNTMTFAYDEVGNRTLARDNGGTYTFTYDPLNRMTRQEGPFGLTMTYTLDGNGNVLVRSDSEGGLTTSTYNAMNLLGFRSFGEGTDLLSFAQDYTPRDQLSSIQRSKAYSGVIGRTSLVYDAVGRMTNLRHADGLDTTLLSITYTYDLAGRVTSETTDGVTKSYSYDATNQLTGDGADTLSYDAAGNRDMTGYTTDAGNRMTSDGVYAYEYDDEGNRVAKNPDHVPLVTVDDVTQAEGSSGTTNFVFTVTLSEDRAAPIQVVYSVGGGTAGAVEDFLPKAGVLTFAPGETAKTVTVSVKGDTRDEDNETFTLNLLGATNARITDAQGLGTITDDDATPTISVSDVTVVEGDADGDVTAFFLVSLSAASGRTVSVGYATDDDTAEDGSDYVGVTGTLTFAPGETVKVVPVAIHGEVGEEGNETFHLDLTGPTNATIADAQGMGTITNQDDGPYLTVADVSVAEGDSGTTDLVFTVALTHVSGQTVTVYYETVDHTALDGEDYTAVSGTLTFDPFESEKTITVAVDGDTTFENHERFFLDLSSPTNAGLKNSHAVGTIENDEDAPTLSIDNVGQTEGNTGTADAVFTVTLSNASWRPVTVYYATANDTATAGVDYVAQSGSLTFAPGETTKTITVALLGDARDEDDETFAVNLSYGSNASIADGVGVGTITDDDATPTISIVDAPAVYEGNTGGSPGVARFLLTLSAASNKTVTVDFASADDTTTVSSDYNFVSGTVTFNPGETVYTLLTVTATGDNSSESDETFFINLSSPSNATISDGQGVGTFLDDDNLPQLTVDDVSQSEGASGTSNYVFTVTLSAISASIVAVDYVTVNGTASSSSDYTALSSSTLLIAAGQTQGFITVVVNGDTAPETDEAFFLNLSNPTNAYLVDNQGVGTINNDDSLPSLSIDDVTHSEGSTGTTDYVFTVTLSASSSETVTVNYATSNNTALAGNDFTALSGALTFAPTETVKTVTVSVVADTKDEADETFRVNLSGAVNATISDNQGVGTVNDDDATPSLSINDVMVTDGDTGYPLAIFTLTLSAVSGRTVTVDYATDDDTATTAAGDYTSTSGTLTFLEGETTKTVTVFVAPDTMDEDDLSFFLDLSNESNATISDSQGVGTIEDDDAPHDVWIGNASIAEGYSGTTYLYFTVYLSGYSGKPIAVDYDTTDGTAEAGTDYTTTSGTLLFAAGVSESNVSVPILSDTLPEADEWFRINLSSPTNAVIRDGEAVGTITNDDSHPTVSIDDVEETEGNSGTTDFVFTVTLSAESALPVTVSYTTADVEAELPGDYLPTSSSLVFAPGETEKTITVSVKGDTLDEDNETFQVNLTGVTHASISDGTGVGTITDDDRAPTISIHEAAVKEGHGGTTTLVFTVELSEASGRSITVEYETEDGSGVAGLDYTSATGTVTFDLGETIKTVTVSVLGDTTLEDHETLTVHLSSPTNATLADDTATGTIGDDDQDVGAWEYWYDHRNQLVKMERRTTEGGDLELHLTFEYDYANRRVAESRWTSATGTVTQHFGYDGDNIWADLNAANELQVRYVRPEGWDALAAKVTDASIVEWYDTDRQGSVRLNLDVDGVVLNRITYNAFGRVIEETYDEAGDRWNYTGKEELKDSYNQYNRNRYLDLRNAKWLTEDPIREHGGDYNYTRYVSSNPLLNTDPSGLEGIVSIELPLPDEFNPKIGNEGSVLRSDLRLNVNLLTGNRRKAVEDKPTRIIGEPTYKFTITTQTSETNRIKIGDKELQLKNDLQFMSFNFSYTTPQMTFKEIVALIKELHAIDDYVFKYKMEQERLKSNKRIEFESVKRTGREYVLAYQGPEDSHPTPLSTISSREWSKVKSELFEHKSPSPTTVRIFAALGIFVSSAEIVGGAVYTYSTGGIGGVLGGGAAIAHGADSLEANIEAWRTGEPQQSRFSKLLVSTAKNLGANDFTAQLIALGTDFFVSMKTLDIAFKGLSFGKPLGPGSGFTITLPPLTQGQVVGQGSLGLSLAFSVVDTIQIDSRLIKLLEALESPAARVFAVGGRLMMMSVSSGGDTENSGGSGTGNESELEVASNVAKQFAVGECAECAEAIARTLGPDSKAKFVRIRSEDTIFTKEHNGPIGTTGFHVGVDVNGVAIDNLFPTGNTPHNYLNKFRADKPTVTVRSISDFFTNGKFDRNKFDKWLHAKD